MVSKEQKSLHYDFIMHRLQYIVPSIVRFGRCWNYLTIATGSLVVKYVSDSYINLINVSTKLLFWNEDSSTCFCKMFRIMQIMNTVIAHCQSVLSNCYTTIPFVQTDLLTVISCEEFSICYESRSNSIEASSLCYAHCSICKTLFNLFCSSSHFKWEKVYCSQFLPGKRFE